MSQSLSTEQEAYLSALCDYDMARDAARQDLAGLDVFDGDDRRQAEEIDAYYELDRKAEAKDLAEQRLVGWMLKKIASDYPGLIEEVRSILIFGESRSLYRRQLVELALRFKARPSADESSE